MGDARRQRILHVALQEFAENGYRGASLSKIAERADLSQPGLLHHFRTKERLLIAVLEYRDELDGLRFLGKEGEIPEGVAAIERLIDVMDHNAGVPGLVQLFTVLAAEAVTADHPAHAWARDRYRIVRGIFADAFESGMAKGEFRQGIDAKSQAARIIAVMDGLQAQWLLDPEEVDMAGLFRAHVAELLDALRA